MNIENSIFKKSVIDVNKLIEYGFIKDNDCYSYKTIICNGQFEIIVIYKSNKIIGKIIDVETNDEYTNYRTEMSGEFVSNVREEYKKVLTDIRDKCSINRLFISNQANRISKYIKDTYSDDPEFLWDDSPDCGVFRNKNTKKWYGIIMNINYSKLDNKPGEVEVINVKLNENEILNLIELDGFYKAYHMNKKSWISIVLDDTLDDEVIFSLIDESYELVGEKK